MDSLRKWFYKPKRDDTSLLAQFFYADEALNMVAAELDSFDGRKDPERCTMLVNHLRQCQDKVLTICNRVMDQLIPDERANRDFRVKFPDDVMQENLAGQLWFGAECLAAGSSIMNREPESASMRPLAKALTKALENVRNLLREQCFRSPPEFGERLTEALKIFDRLFAEFELCYVSAMVPVKTSQEYELQQNVIVLFSETLQRALRMKLLSQEQVDDCDPALMFTIPRLAIVSGLLVFPDGPLCLDKPAGDMSEMFRPFQTLLHKIRELLWTLSKSELFTLEKMLCSMEEPGEYHGSNPAPSASNTPRDEQDDSNATSPYPVPDLDDFVTQFYNDYPNCKQFISDFYTTSRPGQGGGGDADTAEEAYKDEKEEEDWTGDVSESETLVTEGNGDAITLSSSDEQSVPISGGFLLANQVVGEQPIDEGPASLVGGGSLPDSDSQENLAAQQAMSAVQDSLTSLLGANSVQSARDSGVASLDRSPDAPPPPPPPPPTEAAAAAAAAPSVSGVSSNNTEIQQLNCQKVYGSNSSSDQQCSCTEPSSEAVKERDVIQDSENCSCNEVQTPAPGLQVSPVPRFNYAENWDVLQQQPPPGGGTAVAIRRLKSSGLSPRKAGRREASPLRPSKRQQITSHTSSTRSMVLEVPCDQHLRDIAGSYSSSCSSCRSSSVLSTDSFCSSETSSFNSDCQDDEEIALAMQAAEIANRNEARAKFRSSEDLVHRLFVCVAGVADQLQTNFAGDLRNILKCVFLMNASEQPEPEKEKIEPSVADEEDLDRDSLSISPDGSPNLVENAEEALPITEDSHSQHSRNMTSVSSCPRAPTAIESPPPWVPDQMAPRCMSCEASFTVVRRRHHCRHCGKVFCARCSSNSVPLPRYGHLKPVRVCNRCFMYQVTPFTMDDIPIQPSSSS